RLIALALELGKHGIAAAQRPQERSERHIGGGKADLPAALVAALDATVDTEPAPELRRCRLRPAGLEMLADAGRGVGLAIGGGLRRHRLDDKAGGGSALGEIGGGAGTAAAEAEILTDR